MNQALTYFNTYRAIMEMLHFEMLLEIYSYFTACRCIMRTQYLTRNCEKNIYLMNNVIYTFLRIENLEKIVPNWINDISFTN